MDNAPQLYTPWTDRLAMDVALMLEKSGEALDDVLERHGLDADDIIRFNSDPVFLRKVGDLRDDIRERGVTFKLKARAQAEELLLTSWELIHANNVSASVKADLIKSTVKWAGLEPRNDAADATLTGGVAITINLADQEHTVMTPKPKVIEHDGCAETV